VNRFQIALVTLSSAILCMGITTAIVYSILWHYSGMNEVSAADSPGVVLGALWSFGWAILAGLLAGLATTILVLSRYRRKDEKSDRVN
jgi:hypothetical protein